MPRIAHSLCDPDVRPSNGEVSHSEASSIALRTPPSCGLATVCEAEPPASAATSPFSVRVWCVEAWLVWLIANREKETITIAHVPIEPSPTNLTIPQYPQV